MPVPGTLSGFPPYDLFNLTPESIDFRTPAGNAPSIALPTTILGVPMQDVILDPTKLLTAALSGQTISSMVVINIATVPSLRGPSAPGKACPAWASLTCSSGRCRRWEGVFHKEGISVRRGNTIRI
jgi:hypothetical protein